jgi:hypothetical protein
MKAYGRVDVWIQVFLSTVLVGEWSASRRGRLTPGERAHRTHWGPQNQSARRGKEKNLAPTGTRTAAPRPSSLWSIAIPTPSEQRNEAGLQSNSHSCMSLRKEPIGMDFMHCCGQRLLTDMWQTRDLRFWKKEKTTLVTNNHFVRLQVLMTVNISITVLSNVTLCSVTDSYQHFEGTCCLYL